MRTFMHLRFQLEEVEPPIWREILIRSTSSFMDLHRAIQDACGWEDYHLFEFRDVTGKKVIAGTGDDDDRKTPDAADVYLLSYFKPGSQVTCRYTYDFGDDWNLEVRLLGTVERAEPFRRRLLGGARAFPKEDSGGIGGYERFVELLRTGEDPYGEDPEELRGWLEGWEPERFDLDLAKKAFDG